MGDAWGSLSSLDLCSDPYLDLDDEDAQGVPLSILPTVAKAFPNPTRVGFYFSEGMSELGEDGDLELAEV